MTLREGSPRGTHFRCVGEGPPIVLIHGVGADLEMWTPMTAHLSRARRVIAYDMQGHGKSEKPPGPYALADFVRQLRRLAEDLALKSFDLLGFSMGGLVAQGFTLEHPGCVNRLILVNTVYDRNPDERRAVLARVTDAMSGDYASGVEAAIERWFTPSFRMVRPELIEPIRQRMMTNDQPSYIAAYAVFATADEALAPQMDRIEVPTLVITGMEDQRSTPAMAARLTARLPRGTLRLLPGQRHMTPIEAPDRIAGIIDGFLGASVPGARQQG
jgi:(E)-2-((N-methylformamido)methylene)succinate hydrolase